MNVYEMSAITQKVPAQIKGGSDSIFRMLEEITAKLVLQVGGGAADKKRGRRCTTKQGR